MADRLYTGLVHKQLRGNREDALTLEREARTKVGYLFDSMRPGETFKTGSWSLLDGRRIMAFVWNDVLGKRATVRLTGVGGEEAISPTTGLLWSGLAYQVFDDGYPITQDPIFYAGKYYSKFVSPFQFSSFCPPDVEILVATEDNDPDRTLLSELGKVPYTWGQPGLYSGKMRRVIQHMLGAGQVPEWGYKWNDSCWIYTASDGGLWVVNLSYIYGLRIAPLTYIGEYNTGCIPSLPIASGNGEWVELLSLAECSDYFDTFAISADIGFAANTNGNNARNLSKIYSGGTSNTTTIVYEWLVEITETEVSGTWTPTSATLTQVSESEAWTSVDSGVRIPNGPYFSDVWSVNLFGTVPKPEGETEWTWPIFVYYDGDTVRRVTAHHYDAPETESTDPDPKGATEDDVWMSDGIDVYPFVDSFPKSGTGTFALGTTTTFYDQLYFEGVDLPAMEYSYAATNIGSDSFAMEPVDDASGLLVEAFGGAATGGIVSEAVRYRDQEVSGASRTVRYGVWIPYGDREAILSLAYKLDISRESNVIRSVRNRHMFPTTVIQTVSGGTSTDCCGEASSGLIIQQIPYTTLSVIGLPYTVDGTLTYSGWTSPNGTCPLPEYQMPYYCDQRDFERQLDSSGAFDEDPVSGPAAITEPSYAVWAHGTSGLNTLLAAADEEMPMPDWLQTSSSYSPNPLWMTRTHDGKGVTVPFPTTALITQLGGIHSIYTQFMRDHTPLCLWVGEPHT